VSCLVTIAFAQTVSPLQQVMSTSSLITSPQVFREMQATILAKAQGTTPGLHLDDFYKEMSEARSLFIDEFHKTRLQVGPKATNDSIVVSLSNTDLRFAIPLKIGSAALSVDLALDSVKAKASGHVESFLKTNLAKIFNGDQEKAIVATLFQSLNDAGLSDKAHSADSLEGYVKGISEILVDYAVKRAKYRLEMLGVEVKMSTVVRSELEKSCKLIQDKFNDAADELEGSLLKALDKVEYAVQDAISRASSFLVRGNTGIAVSKGRGTFGGGIYLAVRWTNWQLGVYANNQFGKGDEKQTTSKSLFGAQVQFAFRALNTEFQVDALGSTLTGDPSESTSEWGGGISAKIFGRVIVGAALFSEDGGKSVTSFGITLSPSVPSTPTIFLGLTRQDKKFVMQTSFPIGSSN
jgi:hypothetical protein